MLSSDKLIEGTFTSATALDVAHHIIDLVGDGPFVVYTRFGSIDKPIVRRLMTDSPFSIHPEGIRTALELHTTHGSLDLPFGYQPWYLHITYQLGPDRLVIRDSSRDGRTRVIVPLKAPGTANRLPMERELTVNPDNLEQVAYWLHVALQGTRVAYAHPDMYGRLAQLEFFYVTGVWIGEQDRLYIELEGHEEAHLYLLGQGTRPNLVGQRVGVTFQPNGCILLSLHRDSPHVSDHVYFPRP